LDTTDLDTLQS